MGHSKTDTIEDEIETSDGTVTALASKSKKARAPFGLPKNDKQALIAYTKQSKQKQREILGEQWAALAYSLVERANLYAPFITKKDFGRLQQLITTAGIAYDKVCPKDIVHSNTANLMVNLFHGLDTKQLAQVVGTAQAVNSSDPGTIDAIAQDVQPPQVIDNTEQSVQASSVL